MGKEILQALLNVRLTIASTDSVAANMLMDGFEKNIKVAAFKDLKRGEELWRHVRAYWNQASKVTRNPLDLAAIAWLFAVEMQADELAQFFEHTYHQLTE